MEDNHSPYCPDCTACGESGCCSPLCCGFTEGCHYKETYLRDLRHGYYMYEWLLKYYWGNLPKEVQDAYDAEFDKSYDKFYN